MKSMSQLAVLTRRWNPAQMKLEPFQEVVLESSSVEELKEKVCVYSRTECGASPCTCLRPQTRWIARQHCGIVLPTKCCSQRHHWV